MWQADLHMVIPVGFGFLSSILADPEDGMMMSDLMGWRFKWDDDKLMSDLMRWRFKWDDDDLMGWRFKWDDDDSRRKKRLYY